MTDKLHGWFLFWLFYEFFFILFTLHLNLKKQAEFLFLAATVFRAQARSFLTCTRLIQIQTWKANMARQNYDNSDSPAWPSLAMIAPFQNWLDPSKIKPD